VLNFPARHDGIVVEPCANVDDSVLSSEQKEALAAVGLVKCTLGPFNVLVAGTKSYEDAYMVMAGGQQF
jgi:hypothetical protein